MRPRRPLLLASVAALATVPASTAEAGTYRGTVGPGTTITLTKNGKRVTRIPAGRHLFVVRDRSSVHDFVLLRGARRLRASGVSATGTVRWRLRLRPGRHTFLCSTHADRMRGSFRVR